MSQKRETLNERYMRFSYTNITGAIQQLGFPGWYRLEDEMKEDGINPDDLVVTSQTGYTNPVLQWDDNRSIYVDHKP